MKETQWTNTPTGQVFEHNGWKLHTFKDNREPEIEEPPGLPSCDEDGGMPPIGITKEYVKLFKYQDTHPRHR